MINYIETKKNKKQELQTIDINVAEAAIGEESKLCSLHRVGA